MQTQQLTDFLQSPEKIEKIIPDKTQEDIVTQAQAQVVETEVEDLNIIDEESGLTFDDVFTYLDQGQMGIAEIYKIMFRSKYVLNKTEEKWMYFNDVIWVIDTKDNYIESAKKIYRVLQSFIKNPLLDNKTRKYLAKKIDRLTDFNFQKQVCRQASVGDAGLCIDINDMNADPRYIAANNGIIDLHTGNLLPPDPELYITNKTGTNYNPEASEPESFLKFLRDIFKYPFLPEEINYNSQEEFENKSQEECEKVIDYIQKLFGYSLLGHNKNSFFIIFQGSGRNGKSTMINLITDVLGDYAYPVDPNLFLSKNTTQSSSNPRPDILKLQNKRLVIASETKKGEKLDESFIKNMTGHDKLTARALHSNNIVSFTPTHTPILQTNELPLTSVDDIALWERMHRVPFYRFYGDENSEKFNPQNPYHGYKDKELELKISCEREEILKWVVDGALKYQEEGFLIPESIRYATKMYQHKSDDLYEFINECCQVEDGLRVKKPAFHSAFNSCVFPASLREKFEGLGYYR